MERGDVLMLRSLRDFHDDGDEDGKRRSWSEIKAEDGHDIAVLYLGGRKHGEKFPANFALRSLGWAESDTLEHRGLRGTVGYSSKDGCLFGEVIGLPEGDLVSYDSEDLGELDSNFCSAVDEYLDND